MRFPLDHILSRREGPVLYITLNRPDKLNAFAGTMREDLLAMLRAGEEDPAVRAMVIAGAGRAFCAGGDVRYMHELRTRNDVADFSRILDAANAVVRALYNYRKPTLAAVGGAAAGGGANLALVCDIRLGARTCAFTQSFSAIGLGPDWGGSFVLPRIVGVDRARELLLTARTVGAQEALALGLIHELVEPNQLAARARAMAERLAGLSPHAVEAIKGALRRTLVGDLDAALESERSDQVRCFLSPEAARAFRSFAERPRPSDKVS